MVPHRYLSGTSLQGLSPPAAALANPSAFSLLPIPVCAGAHRMALFLLKAREHTSMIAIAKRWLEPMVFVLVWSIAAVGSEKIVHLQPLSCRRSRVQGA